MHVKFLAVILIGAALAVGGCGERGAGAGSVGALSKAFKDGSIIPDLPDSARLAFAHLSGKGLKSRGNYVFEGPGGLQYRLVRVEWVEMKADDLAGEGENPPLATKTLRDKVEKGEITGAARIYYEIVPGKKWLQEHESELIMQGGGILRGLQNDFFMYRSGKSKWTFGRRDDDGAKDAESLFNVYRNDRGLKKTIKHQELAKRLISKAPKPPEPEAEEPAPRRTNPLPKKNEDRGVEGG